MKQFIIYLFVLAGASLMAQNAPVRFVEVPAEQKVEVFINNAPFTAFLYADSLKKQILYPIYTASGKTITRGFPIHPQPDEQTDHPHQVGSWFNFGDVEGLDFWNNSYAIPASERCKYGTIRFKGFVEKDAATGRLTVQSEWVDCQNTVLLEETTTFTFSEKSSFRYIVRKSVLKAVNRDIQFTENKEGMFGLRVDKNLEETATGVYLNMMGDKGGDAWGKRSPWVALSGKKEGEDISIVIIDHPQNINYPGWWHARGYGLFAVNNLGGRAFDEKSNEVKATLKKGESFTFQYKMVIKNGSVINEKEINDDMSF
jgi:hypothetical protein